jgi:glycosyltransferase involved in cell wall biosynthesis
MDALISVVVPVYNVEKYLDACVKSIVSQTYKNIEIILVDDGSKDLSSSKCDDWKKRDKRIKVIHKINAGLGFARNSGLDVATGKYVIYIDSDDYIANNMIEKLLNKAIETESDTVYCGLTRVFADGTEEAIPAIYNNQSFEGEEIIDKVLLEMVGSKPQDDEDSNLYMSVWHALYSMIVINRYNIRFQSERQNMCEDIIYHIDYLRHANKVTYIQDPLYFYRFNPKSLSQVFDATRFERQKSLYNEIRKRMCIFIPEEKVYLREDRRFLGGIRSQILAIVASNEKYKLKIVNEICKDPEVKNILIRYPYRKNPIKHKLFNIGLRHSLTVLVYILAYVTNKRRGVKSLL